MPKASARFIRSQLGDLDALEVARILILGATEAEVLEASRWLDGDEEIRFFGGEAGARVEQIVALVDAARADEEDLQPVP